MPGPPDRCRECGTKGIRSGAEVVCSECGAIICCSLASSQRRDMAAERALGAFKEALNEAKSPRRPLDYTLEQNMPIISMRWRMIDSG